MLLKHNLYPSKLYFFKYTLWRSLKLKLLLLVLSDKGIKFIGEFLLNLLLRKFGLVDYGVFTTLSLYNCFG